MAGRAARTVAEYVGGLKARLRNRLTKEEAHLGIFIRDNTPLYEAIRGFLNARIEGRAKLPEPSDPLVCKSILARNEEIQIVLRRLDFVFHSPVNTPADDSEQPQ